MGIFLSYRAIWYPQAYTKYPFWYKTITLRGYKISPMEIWDKSFIWENLFTISQQEIFCIPIGILCILSGSGLRPQDRRGSQRDPKNINSSVKLMLMGLKIQRNCIKYRYLPTFLPLAMIQNIHTGIQNILMNIQNNPIA